MLCVRASASQLEASVDAGGFNVNTSSSRLFGSDVTSVCVDLSSQHERKDDKKGCMSGEHADLSFQAWTRVIVVVAVGTFNRETLLVSFQVALCFLCTHCIRTIYLLYILSK